PERITLELVAGTIIDCGKRVREHYVPQGYFSVATFQEPGWRTEGKKTLGLEMAEPAGDRMADRRWQLPDLIVYPTGGGGRGGGDGQGVRRTRGARARRVGAAQDDLRPERGDAPHRPGLRGRGRGHHAPTGRPDHRHGPKRGPEPRAYQRPEDHPLVRRLRP